MSGVINPVVQPKRQGGVALTIGAILLAVGLIAGGVLVYRGVRHIADTVNDYQRVPARSGGTVELDDAGTYLLFYERRGMGSIERTGYTPAIITAPDGQTVQLRYDRVEENYTFGGREGRKVGRFEAPIPGTYRITPLSFDSFGAEFDDMVPNGGDGWFAIGPEGPASGVIAILGGVLGGGALAVLGVILLVVGGVRRSRSKRGAGAPLAGWPAPPPPQPQGWGPAGPTQWTPPGSTPWNHPAPPPPPPPGHYPPPSPGAAPPPTPEGSSWAPRAWEGPRDPGAGPHGGAR